MINHATQKPRVSIPKLRSVRLKGGCKLTVIDTHANREYAGVRASLLEKAREAYETQPKMAGWALVTWDAAMSECYRNIHNSRVSRLYRQQIPRYVADKLAGFLTVDE